MQAALKLYRFVEDAWQDGLRSWCEAASRAALDGAQCWLAVAGRGQARWIRQRALAEGLTLFGIKFLDPAALRRELCALLGVESVALGRETQELLLKIAAGPASRLATNADACLRALEDLAAAGWNEDALDLPPKIAREIFRLLKSSRAWTPELDRCLLERASEQPLWSCVAGWDAAHFPETNLLTALARSSTRCEFFLSQPRGASESLQRSWIADVERLLNTSHTVCKASDFVSPHESLVERLGGVDLMPEKSAPVSLLVGREGWDQIRLVRDDVLAWLARATDAERLALIVPRRSATSIALVREVVAANIELLDDTAEKVEPPLDILIQAAVARYHLSGCDIEPLLGLIKLLNEKSAGAWDWLDPAKAQRSLDKAFSTLQSRNAHLLACGFEESANREWQQITTLIAELGKWEGDVDWSGAENKWLASLAPLGISIELLEPVWSQTAELLDGRKISARLFLEYVAALLAPRNSQRPAEASAPHARVLVTTLANALHQTWDRLVFLDSNEGVWPVRPEETPFLDDAARTALNQHRGERAHLLTSGDQSALDQAHFLDLIEHCGGGIVFAANARESGDAAREAYPNEWLIRCLIERHGSAKQAIAEWNRAIELCTDDAKLLPADERAHLEKVHASRMNAALPFDHYLFNFGKSKFVVRSWSAGKLDEALTCPATFALREIFDAESMREAAWTRGESLVIGTRAHTWLARALDGSDDFKPLPRGDFFAPLAAQVAAATQHLRECYESQNLQLPIWWESCLRKAAWVARRCLLAVTAINHGGFYAMEKKLRHEVKTAAGDLRLSGRFDLVLSDQPSLENARVNILDFKTGKTAAPTFATLAKGAGFQFAAYFLMARDAGAASASVGVIRHDMTTLDAFTDADEMALREAMEPLARLQRDLNFGRRGPLVEKWAVCEKLPMATLAIPREVLEKKAEAGLPAD